mgnify:CR=1 FL=1
MSIHLSKIHMKNNDWKERLNVVYSTNPDFKYESVEEEAVETLDKKTTKATCQYRKKRTGWQNRDINQRVHRNRK